MADRGTCPTCFKETSVAQDGTPYKHNGPDGDTCVGSNQQAWPVGPLIWHLYGGMQEAVGEYEAQDFFVHILIGPVPEGEEPSVPVTTSPVEPLATFDHEPTWAERMEVIPEEHRLPPPLGYEDAEPEPTEPEPAPE